MEEFLASKVHLQPTNYKLTGLLEVSQQTYVQTLLASCGVVIGQSSPLISGGGAGVGGLREGFLIHNT